MRMRRDRFGQFDIGGVIGSRAPGDRVLARVGQHLELVRRAAADLPGVGGDRAEFESEAGEDAGVRIVHQPVRLQHAGGVDIERVGILHDEFARSHHAEARTNLVAKLGLDLVEVQRQLTIAPQILARDIGDHLLGSRLNDEIALMTILEAQQLGPVLVPASRLLPEFGRLDDRHQELDRAGTIHFLAHDGFDLAQHAQSQRHPGVDPGGQPLDHAGAQHQAMAGELGFGGSFLERRQKKPRYVHRLAGFFGKPCILRERRDPFAPGPAMDRRHIGLPPRASAHDDDRNLGVR